MPKENFTILISIAAILFSVASFILTFRQRTIEDKRATRKALTDVISDLMNVNIAFSQLEIDHPNSTAERVVAFKRNYNGQRRYLANHSAFLIDQIPDLVTDIDYALTAGAFESFGDYERAEKFWLSAVSVSPTAALRVTNLRGLARFYFFRRGNAQLGRKYYEEAQQLDLTDTDSMRQVKADTYLLWAKTERECGFVDESRRIRELAVASAKRIGHAKMQSDTLGQINDALADDV